MPLEVALPAHVPAGMAVWRLALNEGAAVERADWLLLSADERERAQGLRRHADRLRLVAGRAALRRLLAERLGRPAQDLRFGYGSHGKPHLPDCAAVAFNVAHSASCVLIALGADGAAIGVDVERHDVGCDVEGLAEHALTPAERADLAAAPDAVAGFFQLWSAKEAVLKALGVGLGECLQEFSVRRDADRRLFVAHQAAHWPTLQVCALDVPGGFSAALAWRARE
ncbi:4'-phosphopantetheinyl transferase family protein [Janthinobacterium sp.]|uniref:4'-phosphopantetheinyl transferase family protein n=1 Tax=Janthinobacterium sp. TaxID=1871054 RepID=UPI00293D9529|nr:4'-phosphopantetheinyl transferase superfamily protein [Janthinobacterium sp.]